MNNIFILSTILLAGILTGTLDWPSLQSSGTQTITTMAYAQPSSVTTYYMTCTGGTNYVPGISCTLNQPCAIPPFSISVAASPAFIGPSVVILINCESMGLGYFYLNSTGDLTISVQNATGDGPSYVGVISSSTWQFNSFGSVTLSSFNTQPFSIYSGGVTVVAPTVNVLDSSLISMSIATPNTSPFPNYFAINSSTINSPGSWNVTINDQISIFNSTISFSGPYLLYFYYGTPAPPLILVENCTVTFPNSDSTLAYYTGFYESTIVFQNNTIYCSGGAVVNYYGSSLSFYNSNMINCSLFANNIKSLIMDTAFWSNPIPTSNTMTLTIHPNASFSSDPAQSSIVSITNTIFMGLFIFNNTQLWTADVFYFSGNTLSSSCIFLYATQNVTIGDNVLQQNIAFAGALSDFIHVSAPVVVFNQYNSSVGYPASDVYFDGTNATQNTTIYGSFNVGLLRYNSFSTYDLVFAEKSDATIFNFYGASPPTSSLVFQSTLTMQSVANLFATMIVMDQSSSLKFIYNNTGSPISASGSVLTISPTATVSVQLPPPPYPLAINNTFPLINNMTINWPTVSSYIDNQSFTQEFVGSFHGLPSSIYYNVDEIFCYLSSGSCTQGTCSTRDNCTCYPDWSGPTCSCTTLNIPEIAYCDPAGGLAWVTNTSWNLQDNETLNVPPGYTFSIGGDCTNFGNLIVSQGSSLQVQGVLTNTGTLVIEGTISAPDSGSCEVQLDASTLFASSMFVFNDSSEVTLTIDVTIVPGSDSCVASPTSRRSIFDTLMTMNAPNVSLEGMMSTNGSSRVSGNWQVQINQNTKQQTNSQYSVVLVNSGDKGTSSNSASFTASTTQSTSCPTVNSQPGIVTLFVANCAQNPPKGIQWWYWGIPVIVVGLALIVLVTIFAVPPIRQKVMPYRGT